MRNERVVRNWAAGKAAKAGNLRTDGTRLWSYGLVIGTTTSLGRKVVYDYTANGSGGFVSQTTSRHVGLAKLFA